MDKYTFVTSFSDKLWASYARITIPTVYGNLPEKYPFVIYFNGVFNLEWGNLFQRAEFRDLNKMGEYQFFRQKYKRVPSPKVEEGHQFRFNFLPFWNKVCAIKHAMDNAKSEYLIWLDADLYSNEKITEEDLQRWLNDCDVATLVRGNPWNTWETGFLAFRITPLTKAFVTEIYDLYMSGRIFDQNEWHDAYLFTVVWKKYKSFLSLHNLNLVPSHGHCFDTSILPPSLCHLKGGERKITGKYFEHPNINGVLLADWTGPIGVKEGSTYILTEKGHIVEQTDN